jgi:hypothetical protein
MNNREKQNLDNYITRHYGEDQFEDDSLFTKWMEAVDAAVESRMGCSVYDLPDCCFRGWFDGHMSATGAARKAIRMAKGEME